MAEQQQGTHTVAEWLASDREAVLAFCREHRSRLDESFLEDQELDAFVHDGENPTWLLREGGRLIGVGSLLLDDYHRRGRRARFRILYSETATPDAYRTLLIPMREAVCRLNRVPAGDGAMAITHWFVFVREENLAHRACLEENGFRLFRTSHLLVRPELPVRPVVLPTGIDIRNFRFGEDETVYCGIRNEAFRNLQGSQTPLLPGDVAAMASDRQTLADGIFLLTFEGEPAGVVRTSCDVAEDDGDAMLEIGPLAILPRFQGRGYGTLLLRHALAFGVGRGLSRAVLSVNAENTPALGLYLREGFVVDQGFLCLKEDFG